MEKSNFLRMNSQIISQFGKGIWIINLDRKAQFSTICWRVCNLRFVWWLESLS